MVTVVVVVTAVGVVGGGDCRSGGRGVGGNGGGGNGGGGGGGGGGGFEMAQLAFAWAVPRSFCCFSSPCLFFVRKRCKTTRFLINSTASITHLLVHFEDGGIISLARPLPPPPVSAPPPPPRSNVVGRLE